jgi:pimeloyl-ACP methyl ester carboxylesterase
MPRFTMNPKRGFVLTRSACALAWALTLCASLSSAAAGKGSLTPEYLDKFESDKTAIELGNGERLSYVDTGPIGAPVLVLIHGFTDSARDWAPIAPLLKTDFRLIMVDLRGHGESSKPECCYTRFDFAYDIELLLERLQIAAADIAGHSLGSLVAQTFAEQYPAHTRRLVLISSTGTTFGLDSSAGQGAAPALRDTWLAPLETLRDPIDPDSAFVRDWWHISMAYNAEFARRQRRDSAAIPANIWRAIAAQSVVGVELRPMLSQIRAATLLIWGGRDTLVSEAGRNALVTGIAGAHVKIFSSLGHDLFWEDPAAVAAVMIAFLKKTAQE